MKQIHHVLDIDGGIDRVWQALTTEDGLAGWWSNTLSSEGASVGSRIRFTFRDDFNPVMEVTGLDEDRDLEWVCVDGHKKWQDSRFSFHLSLLEDGRCRLRFWQNYALELSDDDFGNYNFNWGYYLESLRLLCTSGRGKPYHPVRD